MEVKIDEGSKGPRGGGRSKGGCPERDAAEEDGGSSKGERQGEDELQVETDGEPTMIARGGDEKRGGKRGGKRSGWKRNKTRK
eukprot:9238629-Pyramimonas_sp.AAC.1